MRFQLLAASFLLVTVISAPIINGTSSAKAQAAGIVREESKPTFQSSGLMVTIQSVSLKRSGNRDEYVIQAMVENTRAEGMYVVIKGYPKWTTNVGGAGEVKDIPDFSRCDAFNNPICTNITSGQANRDSWTFLEPGKPALATIKSKEDSTADVPETLSLTLEFVVRLAGATDPLGANEKPMGPAAQIRINATVVPITHKNV